MRWLLIAAGVVLSILVLLAGLGLSMPNVHAVQAAADYRTGIDEVYATLTDVEGWPEWHPSVEHLTPLDEDADGRPGWRVEGPDGSMTVRLAGREPPTRFTTLADGGMFVGRWTYHLEPITGGTRLTVTEEARIDNPVIRGFTVFLSQSGTIERMLRALGTRLGEQVTPRRLS